MCIVLKLGGWDDPLLLPLSFHSVVGSQSLSQGDWLRSGLSYIYPLVPISWTPLSTRVWFHVLDCKITAVPGIAVLLYYMRDIYIEPFFLPVNTQRTNCPRWLTITGGHINQDPPYTQKPIYYTFFANYSWSLLLCSPVIARLIFTLARLGFVLALLRFVLTHLS